MVRQLVHFAGSLSTVTLLTEHTVGAQMCWMPFIRSMLPKTRARDSVHFTHSEAIWFTSSSSRRALCTAHISELLKRTWPIQPCIRDLIMLSAVNDRSASHDGTRHTNIRRTSLHLAERALRRRSHLKHLLSDVKRWTVEQRTH